MRDRDFRPAATAVVRLILRACGWETLYESGKDVITVARAVSGTPSHSQIDNIVSWAQNSLSSIFQAEYHGNAIEENDLNAAVMAVADLLNLQQIDELMLQAVKDSSALEQQLLDAGGRAIRQQLLSEDAISAFDLVLRSSCRHLAEVTLSAPEFGPLALQQLLRSNQELTKISRQILDSLSVLSGLQSDEAFAKFTARYLTRLSEQLDFMDIPGVDLERYRQRYSLSTAYIPLSTHGREAQRVEFSSLKSLMGTEHFLLIVGEPGSGKSTLLKWAAVQLALAYTNQQTYQFQIPFLVKLRSLQSLPSLDELGGPMTEGLVVEKPPHWSRDLIEAGRAILLFDGLDEVPEDRRESVIRWISGIYEEHARRGLRIIVTSRFAAVRYLRFRPSKATWASLQAMQQSHIEKFVRVWHRAVFDAGPSSSPEWLVISEQLLARLERDTELSRVASNPLLCAVICALYYARNQHLPSERSELYDGLLSMLLKRRDAERKGIEGLLTLSDIERIIESVAREYIVRKKEELAHAQVIGIIRSSLRSFRNHQVRDLRPTIVLDHLVSRTGVLRELPPDDHVDFWHKSFQEYLAAKALVARGDDDELLSHCTEADWREIVVWACSFMPMARASSLIIGILATAGRRRKDREYLWGLALSCSHYTLQLSKKAQTRINQCASRLIPPRSAAQLNAIVGLGQAAVPFLQDILHDGEAQEHHESVVRALTLIGGEGANTALSLAPAEFKLKWASLLAEGWLNTGSEDYARRVLGAIPAPGEMSYSVTVESFRQLRSIEYISGLYRPTVDLSMESFDPEALGSGSARFIRTATLEDCAFQQALLFLDRYPSIEELVLYNVPDELTYADASRSFPAVKHLTIYTSSFIEVRLEAFKVFPCLESLRLVGSANVSDSNGFSFSAALKEVSIELGQDSQVNVVWNGGLERLNYSSWPFASLQGLRSLTRLRELRLPSSPALETLEGIQDLPEIEIVDVSDCSNLYDIKAALGSRSLVRLTMVDCYEVGPVDLAEFPFAIDIGDDDVGWLGSESLTPALFPERWLYVRMENLSDAELELRGWDDWSIWEEIRGDADEWEARTPVPAEEVSLQEEGLVVYPSFEAWQAAQEAPQD